MYPDSFFNYLLLNFVAENVISRSKRQEYFRPPRTVVHRQADHRKIRKHFCLKYRLVVALSSLRHPRRGTLKTFKSAKAQLQTHECSTELEIKGEISSGAESYVMGIDHCFQHPDCQKEFCTKCRLSLNLSIENPRI